MATLSEKVWDRHVVRTAPGEPDLLYIDLLLQAVMPVPRPAPRGRAATRSPQARGRKKTMPPRAETVYCRTTVQTRFLHNVCRDPGRG